MKTVISTLAAALALAFGAGALAATERGGYGAAEAALQQGARWQTDESLRQGMENIRAALAARSRIFHGGDDSGLDYDALAAQVTAEIALIVQNSRLDPLADAQLHRLIGQMIAGAQTMEGRQQGVSRRAGAERVAEALGEYASTFDHPGW